MTEHAQPKITVCMATRNGEQFIAEQLASILPQLHPDDEVIISDDSSTDRTIEIARSFADSRIAIFENNTFFSPIFNFENALKKATGDVIVLADQDDIWLDNKIELVRGRFRQGVGGVRLIAMDGYIIDASGNVTGESIFQKIKAGKGLLKNVYDNTYVGCCLAFSRPLLGIAIPFPRRIPMHDVWLGLLAELFGKVEHVGEKTIMYRKHEGSMTDFPRRFMPWIQLKRRVFLAAHLLARCLERRI